MAINLSYTLGLLWLEIKTYLRQIRERINAQNQLCTMKKSLDEAFCLLQW